MIKRIRDKIRSFKPQEVVPFSDWKDINDRFIFASSLLKEDNPAYIILKTELHEAEEIVLTNRVHDVKEVRMIGEIQKIFTIDKESQMNELVGQIKFIRGYLSELQSWIDRKVSLEKLESDGKIIIRRSEDDHS